MPIYSAPQTHATSLEGSSLDAAVNSRCVMHRDFRLPVAIMWCLTRTPSCYVIQPNASLDPTSNKLLR
jgi:hypothetical protein